MVPLGIKIASGDIVTDLFDNPTEPSQLRVTWESRFGPVSHLTLLMLDSSHMPVATPSSQMVPLPRGLRTKGGGGPLGLLPTLQYLVRWEKPNQPEAPAGEESELPLCLRLVAPPPEGVSPGIIFLSLIHI